MAYTNSCDTLCSVLSVSAYCRGTVIFGNKLVQLIDTDDTNDVSLESWITFLKRKLQLTQLGEYL